MEKLTNCKICRRAGEKLFLKGEKCNSPKCPFVKRPYAPGQAGPKARPRRGSDYSVQLSEKQKARSIYGISETQMVSYYNRARKNRSGTGEELIRLLNNRLDNMVYRAGLSESRDHSRQIVVHGGVLVNKKMVKSPGYQVAKGDIVSVKSEKEVMQKGLPVWLKGLSNKEFQVVETPIKDDLSLVDEQLIIEFYSR